MVIEVDVFIVDGDLFIDVNATFEDLEKIARDKRLVFIRMRGLTSMPCLIAVSSTILKQM